MSEKSIRKALEDHLHALGGLPTVWQNRNPAAGFNVNAAHQKAFMLPADNRTLGLREKTTLHSGIFQINLCYPSGIGTQGVEERGAAIQEHFAAGVVLTADGVKVRLRGKPSIAAPVSVSPYIVPVTIKYSTI